MKLIYIGVSSAVLTSFNLIKFPTYQHPTQFTSSMEWRETFLQSGSVCLMFVSLSKAPYLVNGIEYAEISQQNDLHEINVIVDKYPFDFCTSITGILFIFIKS